MGCGRPSSIKALNSYQNINQKKVKLKEQSKNTKEEQLQVKQEQINEQYSLKVDESENKDKNIQNNQKTYYQLTNLSENLLENQSQFQNKNEEQILEVTQNLITQKLNTQINETKIDTIDPQKNIDQLIQVKPNQDKKLDQQKFEEDKQNEKEEEIKNKIKQFKHLQIDYDKLKKENDENLKLIDFFKDEQIKLQNIIEQSQNLIRTKEFQLTQKDEEIKQLKSEQKNQNYLYEQKNIQDPQIIENQDLYLKQQLKQIYPRKSLSNLLNEYRHNANIKKIIQELAINFDSYRSIRGDGNCYFRAVGFSFLEHLTRYTTPVQHLEDFINKLESKRGYYQIRPSNSKLQTHQNLYTIFLQLLENLKQKKNKQDQSIQQFLAQELENNKNEQDEALV